MLSSPRTVRDRLVPAALILALAGIAGSASATAAFVTGVHPVEQPPPPVLSRIDAEEGLSAVALSVEGDRAAAAIVVPKNDYKNHSTIRMYTQGAETAQSHEMSGAIRDLLFSPDGDALYALLHLSARRRPGDVYLVRLDLQTGKSRRELSLPPSAQGLAYWSGGKAILIACANEIRSVLLPGMRSGPLYRLLGVNASLAPLDATVVLVGRDDGIAVVDLTDPQGEEEMPLRMKIESIDPVRQIRVSGDGSRVLARLAAAGVVPVGLEAPGSLDAADGGRGLLPSRPWPRGEPAELAPPAAPLPAEAPAPVEDSVEARPAPPPPLPVPAAADAEPQETPVADEPVEAEPEIAAAPIAAAPPAEVPAGAQIAGVVSGPAAAEVASVVISGPDNILREARRIRPSADGAWHAEGLAPGRYRIQLAASDGRILVVDPAFRVVQVEADKATLDADFRVLESP